MSKNAFDGIVFDADGTLLDSMRIWSELGERYLAVLGEEAEEGLADILYPMTLEESSLYLKEKYSICDSTDKIIADILALLEEFYRSEVKVKAGVCEFLKRMADDNVAMGIATSGDARLLNMALRRLGIDKYFSVVVTCSELETSKKDAEIYLKCAEMLRCQAQRTVVFEDILCGIEAAARAGFSTVAVCDFSNREDTAKLVRTADVYIDDFSDAELAGFMKNGRSAKNI